MPTPRVVRRRRAIRIALGIVVCAMAAAIALRFAVHRPILSQEEIAGISETEAALLKTVNAERVRLGHKPLKFSPRLTIVARGHSYDMAIRRYLAHNSPEGATPADRVRGVGIEFRAVGENLYVGSERDLEALPSRAIKRWLDSAEHRANILSDDFVETGLGIARAADGSAYVTQDFIR